ncbi:MAG: hypothetical protein LUQ65_08340 [Candidatus Helarchaeota archaeon]|nr:hypothetical protein [Candidatus Helarchaeota archaeon]
MKLKIVSTIVVMFFLVAAISGNLMVAAPFLQSSPSPNAPLAPAVANIDWRTDGNSTSPEADITYYEIYEPGRLNQLMNISYNDGTLCKVFLKIICTFFGGGLDLENQQVTNWSKCTEIITHFGTQSYFNNSVKVSSGYQFNGFYIVNGTAADVVFQNTTTSSPGWELGVDSFYAYIDYQDTTTKIGHVTLSTRDYSYQNQTLKESIADFSLSINASMGVKDVGPVSQVYIPVVLNFHVTHNVTSTVYKYGADINWSAHMDFPNIMVGGTDTLKTGDDFTLVAADGQQSAIYFMEKDDNIQLHAFEVNDANDTVVFSYAGTEYCRLYLTTDYTLNGVTERNTTRIYIENGGSYYDEQRSTVFVCFDGFKYNESTALAFDPAVEVPSFIPSGGGIGWADFLVDILGLSIVASLIIWFKRRKPVIALSST